MQYLQYTVAHISEHENQFHKLFYAWSVEIAVSVGYDLMIAVTIVKLWRIFYIFKCFTGQKKVSLYCTIVNMTYYNYNDIFIYTRNLRIGN